MPKSAARKLLSVGAAVHPFCLVYRLVKNPRPWANFMSFGWESRTHCARRRRSGLIWRLRVAAALVRAWPNPAGSGKALKMEKSRKSHIKLPDLKRGEFPRRPRHTLPFSVRPHVTAPRPPGSSGDTVPESNVTLRALSKREPVAGQVSDAAAAPSAPAARFIRLLSGQKQRRIFIIHALLELYDLWTRLWSKISPFRLEAEGRPRAKRPPTPRRSNAFAAILFDYCISVIIPVMLPYKLIRAFR
ncbi:hypothetical protein EVAR_43512_1 [Eumeta japonica]|uniref:Uncharacterized protein n=1 Tax=Eumeta variegata TaxID=151549 RepID=A0A4C1YHG2_EUMVA|nr:hypothetical protein EVAR_43512_1 [Eumeta japonica]